MWRNKDLYVHIGPSVRYRGPESDLPPFLLHYGLVLCRGVLYREIEGGSWEMMLHRQQTQKGKTWCCLMSTRQFTHISRRLIWTIRLRGQCL